MAVAVTAKRMMILENVFCLLNAILPAINDAIFNSPYFVLNCEDK